MSNPVFDEIKNLVNSKKVAIFMKGTPDFPQCGFSANAVQVLRLSGVKDDEIASCDVLSRPDIRQAVKEYSNWPTLPQIYINGQFVGGSDIMIEMYQSGELKKVLNP